MEPKRITVILNLSAGNSIQSLKCNSNGAKYIKRWLENESKPIINYFLISQNTLADLKGQTRKV